MRNLMTVTLGSGLSRGCRSFARSVIARTPAPVAVLDRRNWRQGPRYGLSRRLQPRRHRRAWALFVCVLLAVVCVPAVAKESAAVAETAIQTVLWDAGIDRDLKPDESLYEGQRIETASDGRSQLAFKGDARVQVSALSSLEILEFLYDEDLGPQRLRLQLSGTHHLVGGALSKAGRRFVAQTELAEFRVIGAVALVVSQGEDDDTIACLLFGRALKGRHLQSGARATVQANEACLAFTPDGAVEKFRLSARRNFLNDALRRLEGPGAEPSIIARDVLPAVYGWDAEVQAFDDQAQPLEATRAEEDNLLADQRVMAVDSAIEAGLIPADTSAAPADSLIPDVIISVPCCGPNPITIPP